MPLLSDETHMDELLQMMRQSRERDPDLSLEITYGKAIGSRSDKQVVHFKSSGLPKGFKTGRGQFQVHVNEHST